MNIGFCAPADLHALARFCGEDTTDVPPGLGSTATTPLITELLKRGHSVTLFTVSNELPEPVRLRWQRLDVYVERSRTFGSARNFFYTEIAAMRSRICECRPAFLHAHWTYEFALAALGSGMPTVVTIHDLPWRVLASFRDRFRAVRLLMAYAVAARCSRYTAVSGDAARHFCKCMRPGAKVQVIPNFVQANILDLGAEPHARTQAHAVVCAVVLQGWSRRKNGKAALEAFAICHRADPSITLLAMGRDYEEEGPAHRWAIEHGITEGVTFMGLLPYEALLRKLKEEVDVLIHPSLDEAFSMTIVEAMALQIAVIAGRHTPGVLEALDKGRAGMLVDVRQPGEIATAVFRLANDRDLRKELGQLARERVLARYTAEVVVPQYEALYEGIVQ